MLNKAPDPDENRRPRQSMSEWGPGGVSVIQGGAGSDREEEEKKKVVKVMEHSGGGSKKPGKSVSNKPACLQGSREPPPPVQSWTVLTVEGSTCALNGLM